MLDVDAARAARGQDAVAAALDRAEATSRSERFVDEAMKLGCNHPIGPLARCDLIDIDAVLAVMEVFHREFKDPKYRPAPLLTQLVAAGHLGRKSGHGFYTYG